VFSKGLFPGVVCAVISMSELVVAETKLPLSVRLQIAGIVGPLANTAGSSMFLYGGSFRRYVVDARKPAVVNKAFNLNLSAFYLE